jgi:Abortive infection C-terminus
LFVANQIPNSVIGAVSSVIAEHYYSHSNLNALFMESGAPGDVPEGNCEKKCMSWLKRCNVTDGIDALAVLGKIIQDYMDGEPSNHHRDPGRKRILESLAKSQLGYQINGYITLAGASPASKTLHGFFQAGDLSSVEAEFDRAIAQLGSDPHAAITAASSIIEALCKTYIESFDLEMPAKKSIVPLWKAVQAHLGLNMDSTLEDDQKKILQGLASIVDGIGSLRTHIGTAHGRGIQPPEIKISEARLSVNASHTIVIFIMERWHASKTTTELPRRMSLGGR